MLAIGAIVLATASGLAVGLFLPPAARADDPPPTTIPTPTVPEPDPAPSPKPKPKPVPKPAPKPAPSRNVSHAQTFRPPVAPSPSARRTVTVKPKLRAHVKPKPNKVLHKKLVVKKKTTTALPEAMIGSPVPAVRVQNALSTKSGGSFSLASLLVVLALSLAIACFAVAAVPANSVKWRTAAIFVSERQVDLAVIGLALLLATAFTLVLTKGP
jgi:hypothetical protein